MARLQRTVSLTMLLALALPGLVSGQSMPRSAVAGLIVLLLAWNLLNRWLQPQTATFSLKRSSIPLIFMLGLCYSAAFAVSLSSTDPITSQASFALLIASGSSLAMALIVFISLSNKLPDFLTMEILCTGLYQALFLLCVAQIGLLLIGLGHSLAPNFSQTSSPNMFLQGFGITTNRIMMPIGTGMQYPATPAAVLVAIALIRVVVLKERSALLALLAGMVVLALIDSRTALAAPIVAITAVLICRRSLALTFFTASLLPLLMLIYMGFRSFLGGLFDELASGRYAAFGMFSGRETIWGYAMVQIQDSSLLATLFGHGVFSQSALGISHQYSHLFSNMAAEAQSRASLHNSYLQLWLDGGVVGFLVFLSALWVGISRVWRVALAEPQLRSHKVHMAPSVLKLQYMAAVFSLFWVGASEVILLPYASEGFVLVLLVIILPAILPTRPD